MAQKYEYKGFHTQGINLIKYKSVVEFRTYLQQHWCLVWVRTEALSRWLPSWAGHSLWHCVTLWHWTLLHCYRLACWIADCGSFLQIHMDKKCKNQVPKACVAKQASPQWPVLLSAFLLLLAFLAGITWYKRLSNSNNIISILWKID